MNAVIGDRASEAGVRNRPSGGERLGCPQACGEVVKTIRDSAKPRDPFTETVAGMILLFSLRRVEWAAVGGRQTRFLRHETAPQKNMSLLCEKNMEIVWIRGVTYVKSYATTESRRSIADDHAASQWQTNGEGRSFSLGTVQLDGSAVCLDRA